MPGGKRYEAIVIGASAGGLHALFYILEHLPEKFSLPVIIVQHRMAEQHELLEELLQSKTGMIVKQADEKESIEKGIIYLAPPGYHLLIETDRTFSLTVDQPVSYSRPSVDVMFETAAVAYREGLVGIILTGANRDGAAGIKRISDYGGFTIAQDPAEAQFPSMPAAAIATKSVKKVGTLKEISFFLSKIPEV
ncbi:chemotaxis protein CheB [Terrimonas sp. NA20]|uniref:protein-glutamate methylesterase n=1 Tax=Terrimonas ginsenosidimutans TaxID=2908004 RepID=A0ABS9L043_9BACT|nr:chemotaxis protein CheB [Terrimonas ginsenosidimutans]